MKKINKIFMLFAAVAFMLTACEKEVSRDPSPVGPSDAISFAQGSALFEINPNKQALEIDVIVLRGNSSEAQEVAINTDSASEVFNIPSKVSFAAGEKSAKLHITFPTAEVGNSYNFALSISEDKQSPYLSGASTFAGTVNVAEWEDASVKAVLFDGIVIAFFGVDYVGWYVDYQFKDNADGSRDIRLKNPYAGVATDEDDFGIFDAYPYNEPADIMEGSFPWDIHINADNTVSYTRFDAGIDYGYGPFFSRMLADADGNPAYGTFDPETNSITFAARTISSGMDGYGETYGEEITIFLNDQQYRDANLSVGDFNSSSIKWNEVETSVNIFNSELFNFESETQKLFSAEDAYPGNPNSPFINLFCLKDLYAQGANLAFYWDQETNEIEIPSGQFTGLTVAGKKLVIAEGEAEVSVENVKGTDVTTITFDIIVASEAGDLVGEFIETFTYSSQAIVFEKADFLGSFNLMGYDLWDGTLISQPVEIAEDGDNFIITGIELATPAVVASFDAQTGVMTITPPQVLDSIAFGANLYDALFVTFDGNFSTKSTLSLAFKLNGKLALTNDSEAIGYAIYTNLADAAFAGYADIWFERPSEEVEPAAAPRRAKQLFDMSNIVKSSNVKGSKPSVSNIKFTGKNIYRTLRSAK